MSAIILPAENQKVRQLFSSTFKEIAIKIKEKKINLSDTKNVQDIAQGALKKRGITVDRSSIPQQPHTLKDALAEDKITPTQKACVKKIDAARGSSRSYEEFAQRLIQINNEIVEKVSSGERDILLNLTAILHYGLATMNELVRDGIIDESFGHRETPPRVIYSGFFSTNLFKFNHTYPYGIEERSYIIKTQFAFAKSWWKKWGDCAVTVTAGGARSCGWIRRGTWAV